MKVEITDIEYDTDDEDVELPASLILEVDVSADDQEIEELASDYISNVTGWLHNGFNWTKSQGLKVGGELRIG